MRKPADKVNILLVDDQPGKLLTYETILAPLEENLVKASSGDEALQQLLKAEFAVVLLDVCMPQLDGFELARLIREHPRCQRTALIFISAVQFTNVDQLKGYESGAVDYISVPVVPELLRARVMVFADLWRKNSALERMNRELEQRVAERTQELERDLDKRKQLEAALLDADRRKDEFLAVLAHELRNPLAPIRTAVDFMRLRTLEDAGLERCRDIIGRQVEHLTRLVDDLLDVSRITRGKIRLEMEMLEISAVAGRAIETNRPLLSSRRQELRVQLPSEPLFVRGDMTRLSEAVGNLLNNAAKYTDEGGSIDLIVERAGVARADGRDEVLIRVVDSGVGIPPELLPKVFELFTQVDHTLHRAQGGLGIGLALVRRLIEMHEGRIDGYSAGAGKGCEFVIRLPLQLVQVQAAAAPAAAAESGTPLNRRILVVDDNRDAAETLAMALRMHGAEVSVAHDGDTALLEVPRFNPDVVLLDLGMPGMDGLELARRVRALPGGSGYLLVAQTGWGQEEDRRRTREAGFDAHLTKPVELGRLMHLIADSQPQAAVAA